MKSHKELLCPECRVLVNIPIDRLPTNLLLIRILEGLKNRPNTTQHSNNLMLTSSSLISGGTSSISDQMTNLGTVAPLSQTAPNSRSITPVFGTNSGLSASHLGSFVSSTSPLALSSAKPQLMVDHFQLAAPVFARALFNYSGNNERDLSVQKGAIVTVVRVVDNNWVVGECGGRQGFLPSSYVQPLPSDALPQAVALYDFKMPDASQGPAASCLSFNKGEVLAVSRRVDHNWAEGSLAGQTGIFPVSFVQLNAAAAALLQVLPSLEPAGTTAETSQPAVTQPRASSTLPRRGSHGSSLQSISPAAPPSEQCSDVPVSVGNIAPLSASTIAPLSAGNIAPLSAGNMAPLSAGNIHDDLLPPLTIPANAGLPASAAKIASNNMAMLITIIMPCRYVARFPYVPQKADEVALTKGGLYAVTQRCHDGWYKGRCLTTHKTGVFPGNYLQPARY
ncbi:hypothetical protein HAZT_HAZT001614 [Hyalella azteca]|uniref:SH3 domain-containing protein n=1 Tax=Hyalella azteca TaxID=294128 RepID=A0A6A0H3A8_HYAAZ|nr:hypothetical protein HAZT_HAZT001614 [Hyalella azteca]